jgi:hypothetical protein
MNLFHCARGLIAALILSATIYAATVNPLTNITSAKFTGTVYTALGYGNNHSNYPAPISLHFGVLDYSIGLENMVDTFDMHSLWQTMNGGDLQPGAIEFLLTWDTLINGVRNEAIEIDDSSDAYTIDVTLFLQRVAALAATNNAPLAICVMADSGHFVVNGADTTFIPESGKLELNADEEATPYDKLFGLEVTDASGTHVFKYKKGGDPVNNLGERIQYTGYQNGFGGNYDFAFAVGGCWGSGHGTRWDDGYSGERENRCSFFFHRGLAATLGWQDPAYPADVVAVEKGNALARQTFSLQSTPNPFTGQTRIAYSLDKNGPVRLSVYDVTGKRVKSMVNRVEAAGAYQVSWDAGKMPMGVYLLRLSAGERTLNRKIILM